jgi:hypothetical protein
MLSTRRIFDVPYAPFSDKKSGNAKSRRLIIFRKWLKPALKRSKILQRVQKHEADKGGRNKQNTIITYEPLAEKHETTLRKLYIV